MVYYLGFNEPNSTYPNCDFVDGDVDAVTVENPHPLHGKVSGVRAFQAGAPLSAEHMPKTLMWASKRLPYDYITLHGSSIVSPQMKEIIEQFEPGAHQFFPLKVVNKKKEEIAQRFLWVVCNNLDSVDREHTNWILRNGRRWTLDGVKNPKLVYSSKQTAGYHFWRDTRLRGNFIQSSDEAGAAILAAGLTGLAGSRQETI